MIEYVLPIQCNTDTLTEDNVTLVCEYVNDSLGAIFSASGLLDIPPDPTNKLIALQWANFEIRQMSQSIMGGTTSVSDIDFKVVAKTQLGVVPKWLDNKLRMYCVSKGVVYISPNSMISILG